VSTANRGVRTAAALRRVARLPKSSQA